MRAAFALCRVCGLGLFLPVRYLSETVAAAAAMATNCYVACAPYRVSAAIEGRSFLNWWVSRALCRLCYIPC